MARIDPNGEHIRKLLPQHLDHDNSDTFNEADLERLIRHASKDLDEIDRQREEEFKQYELRKEYQRRAKLAVSFDFIFSQLSFLSYRNLLRMNEND